MNLSDALGDWPSQGGGGQPTGNGARPQQTDQPNRPPWPGASNQPNQPPWPGASNQPNQPNQPPWPGASNQPNQPPWPGASNQPGRPPWPGAPTDPTRNGQQVAGGAGSGGGGWWPGQPPAAGGGPGSSKGTGDWPAPSPGTAADSSVSLSVPFSQKIPDGLRTGSVINIKGTIKPNANKVTVDLCTARELAFHFNPRFNENGKKAIVRNSRIGGRWGNEERNLPRFPFAAGQPFELRIECASDMFKVFVQGSHLLDFRHRLPNVGQIQKVDIYNDVTLSNVSVQ
ncbi:galectin-3-like isoform X5 [Syngnathoides biaculeatus]|uniref:galectin-3-like isoform X4 n=1 Tax=Syngnathoides biaculeatus TaxID=300417 RepID=UPI002ADD9CE5|nr:galectin-3-like isoform X4 [Syngnathoides biaculeatus]XP_061700703.1 galectin-3-like isoform X5 [Syngnathoides biaculeatus]